jgi:hypothetical protein
MRTEHGALDLRGQGERACGAKLSQRCSTQGLTSFWQELPPVTPTSKLNMDTVPSLMPRMISRR